MIAQAMPNELISMAQTGEDALDQAVHDHARLVYRIAYSVLRNHHDAEDAAQETFVKVYRHRQKLAGILDTRAWLARIAWRVAVDRRRNVQAIAADEIGEAVEQIRSQTASAEEIVLSTQIGGLLENLIAALPGKLRDPLRLATVEEMSPGDIANVLGVSEAAVRSRLFRARDILRERLTALLEAKHGA